MLCVFSVMECPNPPRATGTAILLSYPSTTLHCGTLLTYTCAAGHYKDYNAEDDTYTYEEDGECVRGQVVAGENVTTYWSLRRCES